MYSNSDNIKLTSYNDANKVVNKLFESLLSKYQNNLETSMRGKKIHFDSVQLRYYCTNVIKWISSVVVHVLVLQAGWKKSTINLENEDDKCF